ncbi:Hypothetical protein A7982_05432 [Minicystis rosea]|nr:Hypothetical protein A7982_05432 [Minicystis rosea]
MRIAHPTPLSLDATRIAGELEAHRARARIAAGFRATS